MFVELTWDLHKRNTTLFTVKIKPIVTNSHFRYIGHIIEIQRLTVTPLLKIHVSNINKENDKVIKYWNTGIAKVTSNKNVKQSPNNKIT